MRKKLDWQSSEVVNIYDEVSLWSAPFAQLLLENIPMTQGAQILDVGFGTGFPLIELAQRFGETSSVYGIDPWKTAIERTREKIRVMEIDNITIFEQSAETIPLQDQSIDLICSNLGVNNFDNKDVVLKECHRVLKNDGHFCITTNPVGTFSELFLLFQHVMDKLNLNDSLVKLANYINHRETVESIEADFSAFGFNVQKIVKGDTFMRFVNGQALFNHALMRVGFLEGWEHLIPIDQRSTFFERVIELIEKHITEHGVFSISIPMVYMEFEHKEG